MTREVTEARGNKSQEFGKSQNILTTKSAAQ